jgi:hypothetical protein
MWPFLHESHREPYKPKRYLPVVSVRFLDAQQTGFLDAGIHS